MFPDDVGDFAVWDSQLDKAREFQSERSEESRAQDRSKRAPVTTNLQSWKSNPDELDFPGIDTPSENPGVLPKDLKDPAPTRTTAKVQDKAPTEPVERTEMDYQREQLASTNVTLGPNEAFEGEQVNEAGFGQSRPSSRRLSEDAYQNLASGPEADMNFIESEEQRGQMSTANDTGGGDLYDFPDWTVSRGKTYLNEKVYGEGRDDLRDLRDKLDVGEPVELDKGEYQTFQRVVREGAKEEKEQLEGMEANIFGDADDQRDVADEAMQGIFNTPPKW